jgi:hypothetical protein
MIGNLQRRSREFNRIGQAHNMFEAFRQQGRKPTLRELVECAG